jgi:hypothetical protein
MPCGGLSAPIPGEEFCSPEEVLVIGAGFGLVTLEIVPGPSPRPV